MSLNLAQLQGKCVLDAGAGNLRALDKIRFWLIDVTSRHPRADQSIPSSIRQSGTNKHFAHTHTHSLSRAGKRANKQRSMDTTSTAEAAPEPVRFRAGKKRKAYRQRTEDQDQDSADTPKPPHSATATAPEDAAVQETTDDDASVATALRLRNARRGRLGGVAFRNSNRPDDDVNNDERALVPRDPDEAPHDAVLNSVTDRFTHQTGMLADLNDKHMYVCRLPPPPPPPGGPPPPPPPAPSRNR